MPRISQLPPPNEVNDEAIVPITQNGVTYGARADQIGGASVVQVTSLPTPTLDNFGTLAYVLGDALYISTANTLNPASDNDVFWVQI